jgi:hypothetical protein
MTGEQVLNTLLAGNKRYLEGRRQSGAVYSLGTGVVEILSEEEPFQEQFC